MQLSLFLSSSWRKYEIEGLFLHSIFASLAHEWSIAPDPPAAIARSTDGPHLLRSLWRQQLHKFQKMTRHAASQFCSVIRCSARPKLIDYPTTFSITMSLGVQSPWLWFCRLSSRVGPYSGHDLALNFNKMNLERHLAICTAAQVLKKAFYTIHTNNTY